VSGPVAGSPGAARDAGDSLPPLLPEVLDGLDTDRLGRWGRRLAALRHAGGRLLALTAEPAATGPDGPVAGALAAMDAVVLDAAGDGTAAARGVAGDGRPGDILLLLSAGGGETGLLRAAEAARVAGLPVWAVTPDGSGPLAALCDDVLVTPPGDSAHGGHTLLAVLLLRAAVRLESAAPGPGGPPAPEGAPLVVVGDALLDRDMTGRVDRVSPEAPVPVVDGAVTRSRPGGAGLAALLLARGGRPVTLVTALAPDRDGRELARLLQRCGVRVVDLELPGATTVKTRVRAADRTLLMLSHGDGPGEPLRALTPAERAELTSAAAVLVSDYGGGMTASRSVRAALTEAAQRVPVVWDPHPGGTSPVAGVRLVTPNSREAAHFAPGVPERGLRGDIGRARALTEEWQVAGVVVTRGADGAVLLDAGGPSPLVVPSASALEGDCCGAGDRFAAAAAELFADGATAADAVSGAVAAAGRFVAAGAAAAVCGDAPPPVAAAGGDDPLRLVERVRARGGTVVATGGCFDLLHTGHVDLLAQARRLGDCLVVCLNDDASVSRLKGTGRPVVPAADRAAVLSSLASVDGVVLFGEDTPEEALRALRPDVWVKGGDYRMADMPEAKLVETWGGRTVLLPYLDGRSTTRMIGRILGDDAAG
jgi:D-beta-D-heptose 7-phosphate kinase/D-beta-D-heptose 1-phosphate adenosyltransferase